MANTLLTIDMITRECLRIAHEKAAFLGTINRQFDSSWSSEGKTGDTLRIRLPSQYTRTQNSRVADVQDATEVNTTLVRATQDHVAMRFNSREMSLDLNEVSKNHLEPAMNVLISGVESDVIIGCSKAVYNVAGTAGTVPADLAAVGAARAKLNQGLAPKGDRFIQMDSVTMGTLVNGQRLVLSPSADIGRQYREGFVTRNAMADYYENERVWSMTNATSAAITSGTLDGPTLVNGLATVTTATAPNNLSPGMVFTVAGMFACHPETKTAYAHLQQFTVVTSASASTMTISPTIYISGARKNVCAASGANLTSTSAVTSGVLTFVGAASTTYTQNMMYHKDAFTFATADLPLMADASKCVRKTHDGLSLRVWQASDIRNDELITRIDILYGYAALRPEWACRITN